VPEAKRQGTELLPDGKTLRPQSATFRPKLTELNSLRRKQVLRKAKEVFQQRKIGGKTLLNIQTKGSV
jgi:hypothetical protein